ncbi:728_t:CDS:2 [Diversispora eburnea]|uniref:728_t:CDS:1 n=1 Tax=Diversispora eburnea TaxID=1213867 RepID=A0A9N9AZP7_9GLOM|nr:728_t:CDS:2 [Diversispora eburnea]
MLNNPKVLALNDAIAFYVKMLFVSQGGCVPASLLAGRLRRYG